MTSMNRKGTRAISPEEIAVLRATLERAPTAPEHAALATRLDQLKVIGGCGCGCDSVDFARSDRDPIATRLGDGIGTTPAGGTVGIIVWGRGTEITSLEIYSLGAEENDLRLPLPDSIQRTPWEPRTRR